MRSFREWRGSAGWLRGHSGRAVARGQARKVATPQPYVGVDEKAFRKGHQYHTIVCDLEAATVEFVAPDRRIESLTTCDDSLTPEQRAALQAVAMDVWPAYIHATTDGLPERDQKIAFDRSHIIRPSSRPASAPPWRYGQALSCGM
jgi:transposase